MTRSAATPPRRRLLCVYQHAPTPGAPGIYRNRLQLAELVRRGWDVDLVSTPLNYMTGEVPERYRGRAYLRETIDGIVHHWVWASGNIHVSRLLRGLNYGTFAAAAGTRALSLRRPDAILVSSPPLTVGMLGPVLARRFGRPWLLEVRDVWPESAASVGWLREDSYAYRALDRVSRRLTGSAAAVVVPTPGLVPWVSAHGAEKVAVIPGAVIDTPPDPARRAERRAGLGVRDGDCLFLYTGAIGIANGLDQLLDAVKLLPPDTAARVVLVGDGSARADIAARIAREDISTLTLLDPVQKEEVASLLAAADVGLHLLRDSEVFESALPTKVLEYLGAHLPFVTTVPGLPAEIAQESGGGHARTAEGLAAELRRWAAMAPSERHALGDRAFAHGAATFSLEHAVDELEQLLVDSRGH